MRTFTFLAAFFALLSLTSAQTCSPVPTCSSALSAVNVPVPYYALNFTTDPRPANAVYSWNTTGANETGCTSTQYHTGILQLIGANHDTTTLGPSVNLSAPFGGPDSIATPLPTTFLFGTGTSQGNVTAGTAGWSVEVVWKAYANTAWAKVQPSDHTHHRTTQRVQSDRLFFLTLPPLLLLSLPLLPVRCSTLAAATVADTGMC